MLELVPNFSTSSPDVVRAIAAAMTSAGATVLDTSSDASHNRTVITAVAPREHAVDAAFAAMQVAAEHIDLTKHQGEHPRIGATDVVPFIPLEGATMEDAISCARTLGERIARELSIPVYLYERAATRPDRENLADVRRGEFEGLRTEITTNPARVPDFGPAAVHPTAGATAIGARPFLVAYNVYLGDTSNLAVAKEVAKAVRGSSGGLKYVKGLGMEVDGQAQVSMNLVDLDRTPLHRAFEAVRTEAAAHGVAPTWSEIVGLVPEKVLFETAARHIQLRGFSNEMVLEHKVRRAVSGGESLAGFVSSVASGAPVPGGGSVAAHVGALAAALAQMVAGLTIGRKKYAAQEESMKAMALDASALVATLSALVQRDADAYGAVSNAYKLPKDTPEQITARDAAIQAALLLATEIPLATARCCAAAAQHAASAAKFGNTNAVSDAGVAALMAHAAAKGAAYNVRINAKDLTDRAVAAQLIADTEQALQVAAAAAAEAEDCVTRALTA